MIGDLSFQAWGVNGGNGQSDKGHFLFDQFRSPLYAQTKISA